ncbi:hypothetical protein PVL29_002409 [Vitis rotundifolia]|uniref:Protein kinase domain-containing protein n=1 Tax=Vitis rotundifolia TaxID=103349 RepID=A0AA39AJI0_VITRO|nr:hypothetical protein PVL29_002409 [Vitis rotundifolia]
MLIASRTRNCFRFFLSSSYILRLVVLAKSNVVGHGGFGLVYRGVLHDGRKVAIKLMDRVGKQGEDEFKVEVELLSRFGSPYLLTLLGYTVQIITINCWFMSSWANLTLGPPPMSLYAKFVKQGLNLGGPVWFFSDILKDQSRKTRLPSPPTKFAGGSIGSFEAYKYVEDTLKWLLKFLIMAPV